MVSKDRLLDGPLPGPGLALRHWVLAKEKLAPFLQYLEGQGTVIAPLRGADGTVCFDVLRGHESQLQIKYTRTALPPKKLLWPPRDDLYTFSTTSGFHPVKEHDERRVLFGLHPCDIHGLKVLDVVFAGKVPEPRYVVRREHTFVVGLDCDPDDYCYCHAVGTELANDSFDLFLTDLGDEFLVRVGTAAGDHVVEGAADILKTAGDEAIVSYKRRLAEKAAVWATRNFDLAVLQELLGLEDDHPAWQAVADRCLACGICSAVCPTCTCHDFFDLVDLGGESGVRVRLWESCPAMGEDPLREGFRSPKAPRLKLRYYHKHVTYMETYGVSGCVGCGRCLVNCPAGISLLDVVPLMEATETAAAEASTATAQKGGGGR